MRYTHSTRSGPSAVPMSTGSMRRAAVPPLQSARQGTARRFAAAAVLLAAMAGPAAAAGDAAAGAAKAWTCLGCHGVDKYVNVYPSYHVPRIAGQNEEYLIAALQAYRGKLRAHQTMQANAGLLSDQDIEDIAAWLSQQGADQ